MKKFSLGACGALCAVTAAITVSLTYMYAMDTFNERVADMNERQAMYSKLSELDQTVRQSFSGNIDEAALADGLCEGYLSGLGSRDMKYFSAEKYKAYLDKTSGKTMGVGIGTRKDSDGNMLITEVAANSPAETAGLRRGDVIIAIDDKEVVRISYSAALELLEGTEGSETVFRIVRSVEEDEGQKGEEDKGEKGQEDQDNQGDQNEPKGQENQEKQPQLLTISVTRAEYAQKSVLFDVISGNVGYIRILQFNQNTPNQFKAALKELEAKRVSGLVLDLRNNIDGDMEAAASIMDVLLPAGVLVSSRNTAGAETVEFTSAVGEYMLPISVVINEETGGAAELFAANIRDYKKGLLVGSPTAGYGKKSRIAPLSDGSAVLFPVADYITLNGQIFDGEGISPDVEKTLSKEQAELFLSGDLDKEEDAQLRSAVAALVRQGANVDAGLEDSGASQNPQDPQDPNASEPESGPESQPGSQSKPEDEGSSQPPESSQETSNASKSSSESSDSE